MQRAAGVALVASCLVAWSSGAAHAALGGGDGLIAFSEGGTGSGVWVMDGDGSNPRQVVPFGVSASFSQDGSRLAYIGSDGLVWVSRADGSDARSVTPVGQVAPNGFYADPVWSPDGRLAVVLNGDRPGQTSRIVVMDADGRHARTWTGSFNSAVSPSWSGDGSLFFIAPGPDGRDVWRVRADGSDLGMLPLHDSDYRSIDVSPSGSLIAYTTDENSGSGSLIGSTSGGAPHLFPGVSGGSPSFAPDGGHVVFTIDSNPDSNGFYHSSQLVEYPVSGGAGAVLTNPPVDVSTFDPAWQPTCTITSTASDAVIYGTARSDVICVTGTGDVIHAERGNDVVYVTGNQNIVHGGPGRDVIVANGKRNRLYGGRGADLFNTRDHAARPNTVYGDGGANICITDEGDHVFDCRS